MLPTKQDKFVYRKRLGFKLREAREKEGRTQRYVAVWLGKAHTWVSKVENGEIEVSAIDLWFLCRHYKLNLSLFLKEVIDG